MRKYRKRCPVTCVCGELCGAPPVSGAQPLHRSAAGTTTAHTGTRCSSLAAGRRCEDGAEQPLTAAYVSNVLRKQRALEERMLRGAPRHCLVAAARFAFCSRALANAGLAMDDVGSLFDRVAQYLEEAKVAAGEMVGTVASTSLGEVCTQLTLNS